MKNYEAYKTVLKGRLKKPRYYHSVCVAEASGWLAAQYGADVDRAYLAGLLHDVCKNDDLDKCLQFIRDNDIMLTDIDEKSPNLWHAVAGALYARKELHIEDKEILNAIRYHTTARKGMSLLEQIVYIADFISDDRDYEDVDVVRTLAGQSLAQAVLYTTSYTIMKRVNKKAYVHPDTLDAYNDAVSALYSRYAIL